MLRTGSITISFCWQTEFKYNRPLDTPAAAAICFMVTLEAFDLELRKAKTLI
jgi:hypothetical protein